MQTNYKSIDISCVVCIDDWGDLEDVLAGSRVKTTISNPKTEELFIFKRPKDGREAQIWSELISSFIAGDLLDWPVQHSQIASRAGKIGNLLGYVFDPKREQLIAGEQLCKHVDSDFDPKEGKRHTWDLIKLIHSEFFSKDSDGNEMVHVPREFARFWARTIAFDTLISNTDRHAENWALILVPEEQDSGEESELMSPFFDNASSLGCEVDEATLLKKWISRDGHLVKSKLESYLSKGCHHLRDGDNRYRFENLASRVLRDFPYTIDEFEKVANLDLTPVEQVIDEARGMSAVPAAAMLSEARGLQMMSLLREGQARVKRCLR